MAALAMKGGSATFCDPDTGRWVRRCCLCVEVKDLERDFYRNTTGPASGAKDWSYRCKGCDQEHAKGIEKRQRQDAVAGVVVRIKDRQRKRQEREDNPEPHRQACRRHRERLRRDGKAWTRYLETQRIAYHLRKERGSGMTARRLSTARLNRDALPYLPAAPLLDLLETMAEARGCTMKDLAAEFGFSPRRLRGWRNGEYERTRFDVADRILTAVGLQWWDVWPAEDYPELHERLAS